MFYAIKFEPIKIQKHSAPQNDCLNLSFVKDVYGNAKEMVWPKRVLNGDL